MLSNEQQAAADFVVKMPAGTVAIWEGRAGSGKTFAVRELQKRLPNTILGAYSGQAARALGGITIDRLLNFPTRLGYIHNPKFTYQQYIYHLFSNYGRSTVGAYKAYRNPNKAEKAAEGFKKTDKFLKGYAEALVAASCVIIEEAYAITCDKIDFMDMLLRHLMKNPHEAFGGKKILLLGDPAQLQAIVSKDNVKTYNKYGYATPYDLTCSKVFLER